MHDDIMMQAYIDIIILILDHSPILSDKVETATDIARSCRLITPLMDENGLIRLTLSDDLDDDAAQQGR